jgi:hypothetical protein
VRQRDPVEKEKRKTLNMKSRIALSVLFVLIAAIAFASDATAAFEKLKTRQGSWESTMEGKPLQVSFRVTSMGSALMGEMIQGCQDAITMFHMDGDRLTHYCDAGNQPRVVGKMTPDGKTMEFDFLDVTNFSSTQPGHMQHVVVTMLDPNHHVEDRTFMVQGGKPPIHEHLNLQRTK